MDDVDGVLARRPKENENETTTPSRVKLVVPPPPKRHEKRILKAASLADILGTTIVADKDPVHSLLEEEESNVPEELKPYYRALVQMRFKLKEELSSLAKSSFQEVGSHVAHYNMPDSGSDYSIQDIALSVASNEKEMLDEVEAAIRRIFDGTYGICEITGKSIPKKRLEALPFARYSVEGQLQIEEQKRSQKAVVVPTDVFAEIGDPEAGVTPFLPDDEKEET
jgi:RNA polymerase-binding transcription factor DksA